MDDGSLAWRNGWVVWVCVGGAPDICVFNANLSILVVFIVRGYITCGWVWVWVWVHL